MIIGCSKFLSQPMIMESIVICEKGARYRRHKMKIHESITTDRLMNAIIESNSTLSNPGFCVKCGEEQEGCEPDAENYKCECCGMMAVWGAEALLIRIAGRM